MSEIAHDTFRAREKLRSIFVLGNKEIITIQEKFNFFTALNHLESLLNI